MPETNKPAWQQFLEEDVSREEADKQNQVAFLRGEKFKAVAEEQQKNVAVLESLKKLLPEKIIDGFRALGPGQQDLVLARTKSDRQKGLKNREMIADLINVIGGLNEFNELTAPQKAANPEESRLNDEITQYIEALDLDDLIRKLEEMRYKGEDEEPKEPGEPGNGGKNLKDGHWIN